MPPFASFTLLSSSPSCFFASSIFIFGRLRATRVRCHIFVYCTSASARTGTSGSACVRSRVCVCAADVFVCRTTYNECTKNLWSSKQINKKQKKKASRSPALVRLKQFLHHSASIFKYERKKKVRLILGLGHEPPHNIGLCCHSSAE